MHSTVFLYTLTCVCVRSDHSIRPVNVLNCCYSPTSPLHEGELVFSLGSRLPTKPAVTLGERVSSSGAKADVKLQREMNPPPHI